MVVSWWSVAFLSRDIPQQTACMHRSDKLAVTLTFECDKYNICIKSKWSQNILMPGMVRS